MIINTVGGPVGPDVARLRRRLKVRPRRRSGFRAEGVARGRARAHALPDALLADRRRRPLFLRSRHHDEKRGDAGDMPVPPWPESPSSKPSVRSSERGNGKNLPEWSGKSFLVVTGAGARSPSNPDGSLPNRLRAPAIQAVRTEAAAGPVFAGNNAGCRTLRRHVPCGLAVPLGSDVARLATRLRIAHFHAAKNRWACAHGRFARTPV